MRSVDILIVGQGLAGSALAWECRRRGIDFLVIDSKSPRAASWTSAGLISPTSGPRLATTWRWPEFWSVAKPFYDSVARALEHPVLEELNQVNILTEDSDPAVIRDRLAATFPDRAVHHINLDTGRYRAPLGAIALPAARLHVTDYLAGTRHLLRKTCKLITQPTHDNEIQISADGFVLPRLQLHGRHLIFCRGHLEFRHHWFNDLMAEPARGEQLEILVPGLVENRLIKGEAWLYASGEHRFRIGATYDRDRLDSGATKVAVEELVDKTQRFLRLPFEVVAQTSATRPIVRGRHPVIGCHQSYPNLGIFNGLGSHGALQAPLLAQQLIAALSSDAPIDPAYDLAHHIRLRGARGQTQTARITRLAHLAVADALRVGESAIDATCGNGNDTVFLAEQVGFDGTVHAFDIQPLAIERTKARIEDAGFNNVRVTKLDHARLGAHLERQRIGDIGAIMFNLGYLPGGDQTLITQPASSVSAISQALALLRQGGVLTIACYRGHPGGREETKAVEGFLASLDAADYAVAKLTGNSDKAIGPCLYVVTNLSAS
ncbi:MAG: FAD-dependent oxidoreductase [Pseudomonadota bacterium]